MSYDYKAKKANIRTLNNYMLAKTTSMFEYDGLPESIPYEELEKIIQQNGYAFITEVDGVLYAFAGTLGGALDVYGNPQEITVTNTFLNLSKQYNVKNDGVLIRNDDMRMGLLPLYEKANTFLVENDINMMMWGYNSRSQKVISAPDDKTKESAELYLKKLIDGDISAIGENALFDGIKVNGSSNGQNATVQNMVELQQYIKASLFNEVGISANFNMKRERLVSGEVEQSEDSLFPFVYNMMKCRIKGIEALNAKYELQVNVDFGSIWHIKNKELVDDIIDDKELPDELKQDGTSDSNSKPDNNSDSGNEGEQEQQREREQGQAPETDPETVAELKAIVADESLPEDEREAAKELLSELEGE